MTSVLGKVKASPAPGDEAEEEAEDEAAEREMFVDEADAAGEEGGQVQRDAEAATSSRQIWIRCCLVMDGSWRDILKDLFRLVTSLGDYENMLFAIVCTVRCYQVLCDGWGFQRCPRQAVIGTSRVASSIGMRMILQSQDRKQKVWLASRRSALSGQSRN